MKPTHLLTLLGLGILTVSGWAQPQNEVLPWEVWRDPSVLPRIPESGQVLLRSSHCPWGCEFDRHSEGDSRFIRFEGKEGVLFESSGPGAITRIWMTTGDGTSMPLDPGITVRFYFDGESHPRLELPLPALFDGSVKPFLPPLVGHRLQSSGGYYSYFPFTYGQSCRITLEGAQSSRLWFQLTHHQLPISAVVPTFTVGEGSYEEWKQFLEAIGSDPWDDSDLEPWVQGQEDLEPGQWEILADSEGPALLTGLRLGLSPDRWSDLDLRVEVDGQRTIELAVLDYFALGSGGGWVNRSLMLGVDSEGRLYSYFPMPYFNRLRLMVRNRGDTAVSLDFETRRALGEPHAHSGLFGARLRESESTEDGRDLSLLNLQGRGRWVGLFAELESAAATAAGPVLRVLRIEYEETLVAAGDDDLALAEERIVTP